MDMVYYAQVARRTGTSLTASLSHIALLGQCMCNAAGCEHLIGRAELAPAAMLPGLFFEESGRIW